MNDSNLTTSSRREGLAGLLKSFRGAVRPLSMSTSRLTPSSSTNDLPTPVTRHPITLTPSSRSRKSTPALPARPSLEAVHKTRPKTDDRDKPRLNVTAPSQPRLQTQSGPARPTTINRFKDRLSGPSRGGALVGDPHSSGPLRRRASTIGRGTRRPDPSPPRPSQVKTVLAMRGTQPSSSQLVSSSPVPDPPSLAASVRKDPKPTELQTPVRPPIPRDTR